MEIRTGLRGTLPQQDDPFADLEIPAALLPSLKSHHETLARFIRSLKSLGMDEAQIESNVSVIVASYREELLNAVKTIARQP